MLRPGSPYLPDRRQPPLLSVTGWTHTDHISERRRPLHTRSWIATGRARQNHVWAFDHVAAGRRRGDPRPWADEVPLGALEQRRRGPGAAAEDGAGVEGVARGERGRREPTTEPARLAVAVQSVAGDIKPLHRRQNRLHRLR